MISALVCICVSGIVPSHGALSPSLHTSSWKGPALLPSLSTTPHHTQIYLFSLCSLCHVIPPVCCNPQPLLGVNDLKPGLRHLPGTDWCLDNFLSCNWPLLMFMRWFVHRVYNPLGAKPRLPGHTTRYCEWGRLNSALLGAFCVMVTQAKEEHYPHVGG